MLDVVERQVELVGVPLGAAELPAVVGEHGGDRQAQPGVERQHLVVQHRHRRLGLLGDVQETEGVGAVRVHDRMQVHPADALERADHEGVGREQFARPPALDVALPEAGVELLQEGHLLRGECDHLLGILPLERQPALMPAAQVLVVEDPLDRDRRYPAAFQGQQRLDPVAPVGWMLQRQCLDPCHDLRRRGHRMALRDRRQVLQPIQPVGLKAPLPVVEAGPVDPATPAGLGDVVQPLGQFQDRQPAMRQLLVGVLGHHLARCFGHDRSSQSAAWISPDRKTRRLRRHLKNSCPI